ncbi:MAG: tRNA-dihydrouridine synthase family protein [Kiritimatiellia bacterium]
MGASSSPMTLILAPLRGVTGLRFRQTFCKHMTGLDCAVAPFIASVAGERVKPEVLRSIAPDTQPERFPLIPQIIGKDPQQLRVMLRAMKALGYHEVDLNAGCPWPFVAKKGRGSGLLRDEDVLGNMLSAGCDELGAGHFSIKVRLGIDEKTLLLKRLPLIQSFPLREICVHPRTARQMYEGSVDLDAFAQVMDVATLPIVYNGDIRTFTDVEKLRGRFPTITRWMIGRGIVANPFLAESIREGRDTRDMKRFEAWYADLMDCYAATTPGEHALLGHLKEYWSYLAPTFVRGDALWNALKLTRTRAEFERVLALFPLRWA